MYVFEKKKENVELGKWQSKSNSWNNNTKNKDGD